MRSPRLLTAPIASPIRAAVPMRIKPTTDYSTAVSVQDAGQVAVPGVAVHHGRVGVCSAGHALRLVLSDRVTVVTGGVG